MQQQKGAGRRVEGTIRNGSSVASPRTNSTFGDRERANMSIVSEKSRPTESAPRSAALAAT
jgi:hypothetical protein